MERSLNKRVYVEQLRRTILLDCKRFINQRDAEVIADRIIQSELMGVPSHGLHYFLHSIRPLVQQKQINMSRVSVAGNVVNSEGDGGVGFRNAEKCLAQASAIAAKKGSSIVVFKNPGKVGALRVYCQDIMDKGQMIILMKNTAATVGLRGADRPIIGTNPLCVGLPDSTFIYDSSISTVATNKMRLNDKRQAVFSSPIGLDAEGAITDDPSEVLHAQGMLLPFSIDNYAFKGFFLGVIIECIAAMAGGKTSIRVGKNKGSRLHSNEGMFGLIVDQKVFPHYANYLKEMPLLMDDLKAAKIRLPNSSRKARKTVTVLRQDWLDLTTS